MVSDSAVLMAVDVCRLLCHARGQVCNPHWSSTQYPPGDLLDASSPANSASGKITSLTCCDPPMGKLPLN
eukprot:13304767-Heterocapsa_arctica.AAC.1